MTHLSRDDLLDALLDLQHDLGKYLRLPLAWLPNDASQSDVDEAVRKALFETREGPEGVRSAGDIWRGFLAEVGDQLGDCTHWRLLCQSVVDALAWGGRLSGPVPRTAVAADFERVSVALGQLIEEIAHD